MLNKYLDKVTLFWYVVLFFVIVLFISQREITLALCFGTFVAIIAIYILYKHHRNTEIKKEEDINEKKSLIYPKLNKMDVYTDVTEQVFSVQDFYVYNPQSYTEFIDSINNFFRVYENTIETKDNIGQNYDILLMHKKNILNSFHSIIFKLPNNIKYTNKLNDKLIELDDTLSNYLKNIIYLQKKDLYDNNINCNTKLIDNTNIVSKNSYDDNGLFSYDIF